MIFHEANGWQWVDLTRQEIDGALGSVYTAVAGVAEAYDQDLPGEGLRIRLGRVDSKATRRRMDWLRKHVAQEDAE